jgi:hypothetical protein
VVELAPKLLGFQSCLFSMMTCPHPDTTRAHQELFHRHNKRRSKDMESLPGMRAETSHRKELLSVAGWWPLES